MVSYVFNHKIDDSVDKKNFWFLYIFFKMVANKNMRPSYIFLSGDRPYDFCSRSRLISHARGPYHVGTRVR